MQYFQECFDTPLDDVKIPDFDFEVSVIWEYTCEIKLVKDKRKGVLQTINHHLLIIRN